MTATDAEKFRREAEREAEACRREAEKATSPPDKEAWLKLAAEWIKLAQGAEAGRSRF
jgi:hypothetical protein